MVTSSRVAGEVTRVAREVVLKANSRSGAGARRKPALKDLTDNVNIHGQ